MPRDCCLRGATGRFAQVPNEEVARYGVGGYTVSHNGPEWWNYEGWDGDPEDLQVPATLELQLTELSSLLATVPGLNGLR